MEFTAILLFLSAFWLKRISHFRLLIVTIFIADLVNFTIPSI